MFNFIEILLCWFVFNEIGYMLWVFFAVVLFAYGDSLKERNVYHEEYSDTR